MLSESLNNAGLDVLTVLNSEVELEWTAELVNLFSDELATILNDTGIKFNALLGSGARCPWTEAKVKALIWHKVQKLQFDIDSTTKLNTEQVSIVYEIINRYTGTMGVSVVFPSKD